MSKVTLNSLASLANQTSAISTINGNSTAIQTAFDNTLSRDGTSPNSMGANLDMNSNRILNLIAPSTNSEPLRLGDIATVILTAIQNLLARVATTGAYSDLVGKPTLSAVATTGDYNNLINTPGVFTSVSNGFVPASGGGTTAFLRADGAWTKALPGTGTVTQTGTPVANQLPIWTDAVTLKAVTVSGDGTLSGAGALVVTKTNGVAFATSATTDTTNAANISSGTLPAARLPSPAIASLGGVNSKTAVSHNFLTAVNTDGSISSAQPAATDISGLATSATTDTTNAANISSGTLPAARLPTPAVATLGGVFSKVAVSHQFLTQIGTDGSISQAQPAFTDISGTAAASQLPLPGSASLGGVFSKAAVSHQFLTSISSVDGSIGQAQPAFTDISGSVAATQLPNPSATTLGGIQSLASVTSKWINTISTSGVPSATQPAFSDISGSVAASQLPNPSASTLGGVESIAAVSHNFLTSISTSGVPAQAQPAFTDISGRATSAQVPTDVLYTDVASQTVSGGATVTATSLSTGNITVDPGKCPLQFITNGGAFTITAPAADGYCLLLITNNASAGAVTFSGFTVGTNTGDALTTTNTNKFIIFIYRINGTAAYSVQALQ